MKTTQKGFIVPLLILIVAVLLVGGGAYFYTQNKSENPPVTKNVTLPQATSTAPAANQTAPVAQTSNSQMTGWKTYTNIHYSYTIEYPSNWYAHTTNSEKDFTQRGPGGSDIIGGDTSFSNYQEEFSYDNPAPKDLLSVNLMIYKIESNISYDQFISSKGFRADGREDLSINGISALRLMGVTTDHPVGVTVVNTLVKVGNKMFVFNYSGSPVSQQLKDDTGKIINSFAAK